MTRTKKNNVVTIVEEKPIVPENTGLILKDALIHFNKKDNPYEHELLRQITIFREGKRPLVVVTNLLDEPAENLANAYKTRWEIELFFKWLKQNAKIKTFFGENKNAVMTQIWEAMYTHLIVIIYQNTAKKHEADSAFT